LKCCSGRRRQRWSRSAAGRERFSRLERRSVDRRGRLDTAVLDSWGAGSSSSRTRCWPIFRTRCARSALFAPVRIGTPFSGGGGSLAQRSSRTFRDGGGADRGDRCGGSAKRGFVSRLEPFFFGQPLGGCGCGPLPNRPRRPKKIRRQKKEDGRGEDSAQDDPAARGRGLQRRISRPLPGQQEQGERHPPGRIHSAAAAENLVADRRDQRLGAQQCPGCEDGRWPRGRILDAEHGRADAVRLLQFRRGVDQATRRSPS
jgi:hypothetical protein